MKLFVVVVCRCLLVELLLGGLLMLLESLLIIEAILVSRWLYGLEGLRDCVVEEIIAFAKLRVVGKPFEISDCCFRK